MNKIFLVPLHLLLLIALVGGALASATPQDPPRVSVQLNTGIAKLGETVVIQVHMDGTTDGSIGDLPDVPGLKIGPVPGPRTSRGSTLVNGRMSVQSTVSWSIPVRASAEGEYEIPPFLVTAGGNVYETNPMQLRVKEDLAGAELGLIQVEIQPSKVVVGQPFDVVITFGWDTAVRKLNHADLSLPWWGQIPGAIEMEGSGDRELGKTYARVDLNGRSKVEVIREGVGPVNGRNFELYSLRRSYLATSPGLIEFPSSHLKFGEMIVGNFLGPSREGDMYFTKAEPTSLVVGTLPETGRPDDYLDAVGSMEVRAEIDRREVNAGDSIKLRVEWSGDGNFEFFTLPDIAHLDAFEGINFYGVTDELKERNRRVSVFDLAPLSENITELPSIPLVVYNPVTEVYERVATKPISIRVHKLEGTGSLELTEEDIVTDDIRDIRRISAAGVTVDKDPMMGPDEAPNFLWRVSAALGALLLTWAGLRTWIRKSGDPSAPAMRRRRAARRNLSRGLKRSNSSSDRLQAFGGYLSARSGEGDGAWIGRDMSAASDQDETMADLAKAMGALDAAVWGESRDDGPTDHELLALAKSAETVDLEAVALVLQGDAR